MYMCVCLCFNIYIYIYIYICMHIHRIINQGIVNQVPSLVLFVTYLLHIHTSYPFI